MPQRSRWPCNRVSTTWHCDLISLVGCPSSHPGGQPFGFLPFCENWIQSNARNSLTFSSRLRQELIQRMNAERARIRPGEYHYRPTKLRNPAQVGSRWARCTVRACLALQVLRSDVEKRPTSNPREKTFREIQLPDDLKGWFKPDYNDSQWSAGRAPIGSAPTNRAIMSLPINPIGQRRVHCRAHDIRGGKTRLRFYRLSILNPQGFKVYLNGHQIVGYGCGRTNPTMRLGPRTCEVAHLKRAPIPSLSIATWNTTRDESPVRPVDCFIEGSRHLISNERGNHPLVQSTMNSSPLLPGKIEGRSVPSPRHGQV